MNFQINISIAPFYRTTNLFYPISILLSKTTDGNHDSVIQILSYIFPTRNSFSSLSSELHPQLLPHFSLVFLIYFQLNSNYHTETVIAMPYLNYMFADFLKECTRYNVCDSSASISLVINYKKTVSLELINKVHSLLKVLNGRYIPLFVD